MRRPVRRAPAGGLRVPRRARAAEDRRRVPALHPAPARDGLPALPGADAVDGGGAACSRSLSEGALAAGYNVPRGSALRSVLGRGDQTACEYRTAHDVTLWPLELAAPSTPATSATWASFAPAGAQRARRRCASACEPTAGLTLRPVCARRLTLYLRGSDELPARLYEQLLGHGIAVLGRSTAGQPARPGSASTAIRRSRPVGFDDDEALLPYGPRSFQGYRLLQEYFAFPQRYLFVELAGLAPAVRGLPAHEIEIVVLTRPPRPALEGRSRRATSRCYCTPAINLFPRRADRIHLTDGTPSTTWCPTARGRWTSRCTPSTRSSGYGTGADAEQEFQPFYAWHDRSTATARRPTTPCSASRACCRRAARQGARSSYVGSEVYISLVDADEGPYPPSLRQLAVETLCTNRDLPLHMALGQGRDRLHARVGRAGRGGPLHGRPDAAARLARPGRASSWRLISHLSLNYLSLVDDDGAGRRGAARAAGAVRRPGRPGDAQRQIEGVRSVERRAPITPRLPVPGPIDLRPRPGGDGHLRRDGVRGDRRLPAGRGAGAVLRQVRVDQLVHRDGAAHGQRGEIMRWPADGLENLV